MTHQALQRKQLQLIPYTDSSAEVWDAWVEGCPMTTFMHTRRFIAYHGDRFQDQSLLLYAENGTLLGLFPAAINPQQPQEVVSHPGLSFGGLLHSNTLQGEDMLQAFQQIQGYYRQRGFESLKYKVIPSIYHQLPAQDDLYALFRLNAVRYRCDLASTLDVTCRPPKSQKRKWELKQALQQGLEVAEGPQYTEALWKVLEENLIRKHQAIPVHSLQEIQDLQARFPQHIHVVVGLHHNTVVAGLVLFSSPNVMHVQYMASSPEGIQIFALHPVIEHCIAKTQSLSVRYFDFGMSNEQDGRYLNQGLHLFKSKFGATATLQEFYQLDLREP